MKNNLIFCLSPFAFCLALNAQTASPTVVASGGGFGQSAAGSVSWTLGQLATTTATGTSGIVTQGFQQPEPAGSVPTDEPAVFEKLLLFPNPTLAEIRLSFSVEKPFSGNWEIIDQTGRSVLQSPKTAFAAGDFSEKIDLAALTAGAWFFILKTENGATRTARFLKL